MTRDRPRPLARADPQAARRLAGAAADRLRRPLPVPPPRSRDADRGDDGGADRGLRGGQGRARSASASGRVEQIQAALEVPGAKKFVSSQPQYNMIWRAPEAELIPFCAEHGISQIVWSPLAQGVLTGKYKPGEEHPSDSRAASDAMGWAMDRYLTDEVLEAVQRLEPIAEGAGLTMVRDGARLGAARAERRLGDHRRLAPRAGPRQRRGVGHRALGGRARGDRRGARRRRRHRARGSPNFVEEGVKHR